MKMNEVRPGAALMAQLVKKPPAVRETWAQSLGWEDPLQKGKAAHSSILAWRIPWREAPVHGIAELDTTHTHTKVRLRHDKVN